jgi:hypothetical protein
MARPKLRVRGGPGAEQQAMRAVRVPVEARVLLSGPHIGE